MKVVLYGASGMIGSRVLHELVSRGHQVTAVVRNPAKVSEPNVKVLKGDVLDRKSVAETAKGMGAAICAYSPPFTDTGKLMEAAKTVVAGLKDANVRRFLMVSGAGSLEVAPGVQLVNSPGFPEAWKPIALAHGAAIDVLKNSDLDWTAFSPAAIIEPGKRTGKFRLGTDTLVTDAKGESKISVEDYAIALVDELENPRHIRQRFTIGY